MSNHRVSECPICQSKAIKELVNKDTYTFYQCPDCEFVFLNPMPKQTELNALYTDTEQEAEPTYNKASSRLRRAWIKLPRFFPYALNRDCLDLGCGGGFIAHVLSIIAKSSTGIDISQQAIDYASQRFPKVNFQCRSFTGLLEDTPRYDFIYSSEVIEHVSDIRQYMQVLKELTRENGHVYITTPDMGHANVPSDITNWDVFTPPVHVQFLTQRTATRLFEQYGFRIKKFYRNRKPGLIFLAQKTGSGTSSATS